MKKKKKKIISLTDELNFFLMIQMNLMNKKFKLSIIMDLLGFFLKKANFYVQKDFQSIKYWSFIFQKAGCNIDNMYDESLQ